MKSKQVFRILLTLAICVGLGSTAFAHNPAAQELGKGFAVGIALNAEVTTNSFGYRLLRLLNKHWTDDERLAVADSLAEGGLALTALADPGVYIQYGNFRIHGGAQGEAEVTVPKKLAELAFRGITLEQVETGDLQFDLAEVRGQGGAYAAGGLSAAFSLAPYVDLPFDDVVVGVSGRYLHGLAYGETDFGGELEYFEEDGSTRVVSRDLDLKILQSRSGQGWAFDAGVMAQVSPRLAVDVSVANIGQVVWTDVSGKRWHREGEWELVRLGFDPETYEFEFEFADGEGFHPEDITDVEQITWKLPVRTRFGVQYDFDRQVTLRGNVRHTRYASGDADIGFGGQVEYRPLPFVPITVGADYSTKQQLMLDAGVGLRFTNFKLQLAAKNLHSLFLSEGKGLGLAVTLGLHF